MCVHVYKFLKYIYFQELIEENSVAIETFLYLLFLVLFTVYAIGAQGAACSITCMFFVTLSRTHIFSLSLSLSVYAWV